MPLGKDDEVIIDDNDHNRSRNNLKIQTNELQNFPTQERLDYMSANWFDKSYKNNQKES